MSQVMLEDAVEVETQVVSDEVVFHGIPLAEPKVGTVISARLAAARKRAAQILRESDDPGAIERMPLSLLACKHAKDVTITAGRDFAASLADMTVGQVMDEHGAIANCRALEAQAIENGSFSRLLAKDDITTLRLVSGGRNETAPQDACTQTSREYLRQFNRSAE